jgi:hypothetical protein
MRRAAARGLIAAVLVAPLLAPGCGSGSGPEDEADGGRLSFHGTPVLLISLDTLRAVAEVLDGNLGERSARLQEQRPVFEFFENY